MAPADDRLAGPRVHVRAHADHDVLGAGGRSEVEALPRQGPLAEVHVLVPQTRDQPAAVGVDLLDPGGATQVPAHLDDQPAADVDVQRHDRDRVLRRERHQPGTADQEVSHATQR